MKNKKAFTLIELLATIVVLAIIATIGYMIVGNVITSTKVSTEQSSIKEYARAIEDARYNYLALEGVDIYKNISIPQSWLTENVKTGGNQVKCYQVNYQSGFHLVGCKVGNGNDLYCYKDNEFYDCTNNVENVITRVYGNSVQNGIPNYDNHVEIQSVGDKTINIFDISKTVNSNLVNNGDGTYTLTKYSSSQRFSEEVYVDIPANTPFSVDGNVLEYTGTYSQKLQLTAHCTDGTTKYLNMSTDNLFKKFTYACNIDKMRFYLDASNADGTKVTFKDFIIAFGNTEEEYEPYGKYKLPIKVSGNNLIDYKSFKPYGSGTITLLEEGLEYTGTYYIVLDGTYLLPGETYYMSWEYTSNDNITPKWRIKYSDGTYSSTIDNKKSIKIPSDKNVEQILIYPEVSSTTHTTKFTQIQLGTGTVIKEYEPYVNNVYNIYLDEPLRKVGDYADYIDLPNKKVVRNIKEVILDGSADEDWRLQSINDYGIANFHTNVIGAINNSKYLSDRFVMQNTTIANTQTEGLFYANASTFYIRFNSSMSSTAEAFKTWLSTNNTKIYVILPVDSSQTVDIPNIPVLTGNVSYSINTNIPASNICYLISEENC